MRIRILRPPQGYADGVDLRTLQVGFNYDVSPALGAKLVHSRSAELVGSQEPMLLVAIAADPRVPAETRSLSVADDFGRRESILAFEPFDPD